MKFLILLSLLLIACEKKSEVTHEVVNEEETKEQTLSLPQPVAPDGNLPAHCTPANGVYSISLPIYYDRPDSPKFNYYFQIKFATGVDWRFAPVIYLNNGGPGTPGITKPGEQPPLGAVPNYLNQILTDVRGIGCNVHPFTRDAYRNEYFALDNLSVVYALKLSNYFIFGLSAGTIVSTMMTELAPRYPIPQPKALILEGTFGKHLSMETWKQQVQAQWVKTRTQLPAPVVSMLASSSMPYGYSSGEWAAFIYFALKMGAYERTGNPILNLMALMGSTDPILAQVAEDNIRKLMPLATAINFSDVGLTMWCEEMYGDTFARDIQNGEFFLTGPDFCAANNLSLVRPYDPKDHKVNVPVYYFQGNDDPATANEGAFYHFNSQNLVKRTMIVVDKAGHGPLTLTLKNLGCANSVWFSLIYSTQSLQSSLNACSWPITVQTRMPGAVL